MPMIMRWFTGHSWHKWGPLGPLGHRHGFMRIQTAPARWLQDSKLLFLWWSIIPCLALDKPLFRAGYLTGGDRTHATSTSYPSWKVQAWNPVQLELGRLAIHLPCSDHHNLPLSLVLSKLPFGNQTWQLNIPFTCDFPIKSSIYSGFPSQPWKWTTSPSAERCSVAETRRTPRCHGRWRCFPHDSAARV